MKIAIISFYHSESSLVLSEHLARLGNRVDYYYISRINQKEAPAFPFALINRKPGIRKLNLNAIDANNSFFRSQNISLSLITLLHISRKTAFLEKLIIRVCCRELRRKKYDVINMIGQHRWLINFHKGLKNVKRIHTLHEVNSHYKKQNFNNRLIEYLDKNDIPIIVHSNYTKKNLLKKVKQDLHNSITMIPFGVFETYNLIYNQSNIELSANTSSPYVLFYGLIRPYKGLKFLFNAVKLLSKDIDLKFVVAGFGWDPVLESMRNDDRFVIINKKLSNLEIVNLNKNALFIICPYTSASQSGIVSTSFLFEKPIIATNVGAFSEVISHRSNGILAEPGNSKDLADKILLLYKDKELYSKLCEEIRTFPKKFRWEKISQNTLSFYKNKKTLNFN